VRHLAVTYDRQGRRSGPSRRRSWSTLRRLPAAGRTRSRSGSGTGRGRAARGTRVQTFVDGRLQPSRPLRRRAGDLRAFGHCGRHRHRHRRRGGRAVGSRSGRGWCGVGSGTRLPPAPWRTAGGTSASEEPATVSVEGRRGRAGRRVGEGAASGANGRRASGHRRRPGAAREPWSTPSFPPPAGATRVARPAAAGARLPPDRGSVARLADGRPPPRPPPPRSTAIEDLPGERAPTSADLHATSDDTVRHPEHRPTTSTTPPAGSAGLDVLGYNRQRLPESRPRTWADVGRPAVARPERPGSLSSVTPASSWWRQTPGVRRATNKRRLPRRGPRPWARSLGVA